jgi:hypothetical protein
VSLAKTPNIHGGELLDNGVDLPGWM